MSGRPAQQSGDTEDLWMVIAIIQPFKLDAVTLAVEALPWLNGMTVTKCAGLRHPAAPGELRTGEFEMSETAGLTSEERRKIEREQDSLADFADRVKVEIAVSSRRQADEIAQVIAGAARTGRSGDGKIFLLPLSFAGQIGTMGEKL